MGYLPFDAPSRQYPFNPEGKAVWLLHYVPTSAIPALYHPLQVGFGWHLGIVGMVGVGPGGLRGLFQPS